MGNTIRADSALKDIQEKIAEINRETDSYTKAVMEVRETYLPASEYGKYASAESAETVQTLGQRQ